MNAARLLWRQFSAERWPALLLALSVGILAALAAATPRLMASLDDRQLAETLSGLSALQGDVSGSWAQTSMQSPVAGFPDPWEPHRESLETVRTAQPEPLRSLLAPAQFLARVPSEVEIVPPQETGYYLARFSLFVDPDLAELSELVDGAWPSPRPVRETEAAEQVADGPQEVAAPAETAERMGWRVGEPITENLTLSGTFRPTDPGDTRWDHVSYARTVVEESDPDRGVRLISGLFLPTSYLATTVPAEELGPGVVEALTIETWFGVDTSQVGGVDVRALRSQLTGMLAKTHPVLPAAEEGEADPGAQIRLTSELGEALTRVAAQQDLTRAVLAVAAAGPLAVGVALVILAAQLVIERRRATLELVSARGLSTRQLRRLVVAEGLVLGVPAALVGHLIGSLLIPGATSLGSWLVALALGAVPAAGLDWAAHRVGTLRARADLSLRPGRARVVFEAVTAIATAAAIWAILSRDDAPTEGLDLLATATPVLITILACLVALRLYPLPLRLATSWLRRGRGLPAFLGTVRAHRDPAGGLTPVFTVVLGTTIAVLSAALLGSVVAGTERATWEATGSSLHVSGPRISDDMAAQLSQIDGVRTVARIHDAGTNHRFTQDGDTRLRLWLAEPTLPDAYAASPSGSSLPEGLFDDNGDPGLVLGSSVDAEPGEARLDGPGTVRVLGSLPAPPGVRTGPSWGMLNAERWNEDLPPATLALVALDPSADPAVAAEAVAEIVGPARVTAAVDALRAVRDTPTVSGLTAAFGALTAATAVLLALTLFGSQLMATRTRTYLGAILRTLGMGRRELRTLTAWEVAPSAILGLVLGTGLGIGLAALLLATLDFRSVTGGAHPPTLHLSPALLGGVLGLLVATVAATIAVTAWLAGRSNLAHELRIGEER